VDAEATVAGVVASWGDRLRWWFVVVATAAGMIAMHSLAAHEHTQAASAPTVMMIPASSCCEGEHAVSAGALPDEDPHEGSSLLALLHLCLAVLTGFTPLAIAALLAFIRLRADILDRLSPLTAALDRTRSPPPTSVRLAQLCVLRC
jgi:hypothetical protein